MDTNLYKVSKVCWAVTSDNRDTQVFKNIEDASVFLENMGVKDEEIDLALVDMLANESTRANFGVEGKFIFSDKARLNELLGVA
jgi:hypothetical protein